MMNFMERGELQTVLDLAKQFSRQNYTIMALMGYAGLRISEATRLRWCDIAASGTITLTITVPAGITKRGRARDLPLPQPLHEALMIWHHRRPPNASPQDFVFPGNQHGHISSRALQLAIRRIGYAAINRRITPHTFRHTFCTLLAREVQIRAVQEAAGHRFLSSTQIYTHPTRSELTEGVNKAFSPKPILPSTEPPTTTQYEEGHE